MSDEVTWVFWIISFRSARKLNNYHVRAKLTDQVDRLNVARNAEKYPKMSVKLKTLLSQLHKGHTKPIAD